MKIETLLEKKGRGVVTVRPEASILSVADLMRQHRIGCVIVSADGRHVAGLVVLRDIVYALASFPRENLYMIGTELLDAPVSRIMAHEVHTCGPRDSLRHVMMEMTRLRILHVPVLENGEIRGIVSNDDVVKYAVHEMDLEKGVLHDSLLMLQTLRDIR